MSSSVLLVANLLLELILSFYGGYNVAMSRFCANFQISHKKNRTF